ncbi:hypothetical protein EDB83DRAFT_251949 [Lactarius deliciosus]|nr:hypothetical protein EDB83DRAFT_251949 [Lactarius deliciosus]
MAPMFLTLGTRQLSAQQWYGLKRYPCSRWRLGRGLHERDIDRRWVPRGLRPVPMLRLCCEPLSAPLVYRSFFPSSQWTRTRHIYILLDIGQPAFWLTFSNVSSTFEAVTFRRPAGSAYGTFGNGWWNCTDRCTGRNSMSDQYRQQGPGGGLGLLRLHGFVLVEPWLRQYFTTGR